VGEDASCFATSWLRKLFLERVVNRFGMRYFTVDLLSMCAHTHAHPHTITHIHPPTFTHTYKHRHEHTHIHTQTHTH